MCRIVGAVTLALLAAAWSADAATLTATQANLTAVWKAARPGDEISVSGPITGPFAGISKAAPGVKIVAEPGASIEPDPRSGWFFASGIEGVRFVGFAVHTLMQFNGRDGPCARVTLDDMDFSTPKAGIQFRECLNADPADWVSVLNSRFRGGSNGVGAIRVRGLNVLGNSFTDNPADAIQLGVLGDVRIEGNSFTNFRGEPLHRDAIQLIAADQTVPITNVVIRGNRLERGDGIPAQFIFLSDSAQGYDLLWVEGNVAFGPSFHGITVNMPIRATIENNFLQADARLWNGQLLVPWIKPMNVPKGAVVMVRNNTLPSAAAPDDRKALTAWMKRAPLAALVSPYMLTSAVPGIPPKAPKR